MLASSLLDGATHAVVVIGRWPNIETVYVDGRPLPRPRSLRSSSMSESDDSQLTQKTPTGERTGETERTPGGLEIPIPTREEFFGNLRKAAKPQESDDEM